MKPMSLKKRRSYFYLFLALFLIAIPIITLYTSGYRIGEGFRIVETGGVYIYSPISGSEIYIDNKKKKETSTFQKDLFIQNLVPGTYSVLISKKGYWPWAKEVTIEKRKVAEAIAFLIPQSPIGITIPRFITENEGSTTTPPTKKPNKEYADTEVLFDTRESADKKEEALEGTLSRTSNRGRMEITRDGAEIHALWLGDQKSLPNYFCRESICESPILVFNSVAPIQSFDFYPGREDVLLIAVQNGIYAIEIDARKHQNFQPIYKGIAPSFIVVDETLYIQDDEVFLKLVL